MDFEEMAKCHPKLKRGRVWCRECGKTVEVNTAQCLQKGWPECCGQTMTIDAPDEQ